MADTGASPAGPGLEPRVARWEGDVAEIKATLNRLAPLIDDMHGFLRGMLPHLATKADLAELRTEMKIEIAELRTGFRVEIARRPTRRQAVFDIFAIVGLIGAILTIAARLAH
jgi:hypothetical protein